MRHLLIVAVFLVGASGRLLNAQEPPASHRSVAGGVYVGAGTSAKDSLHYIAIINAAGVARIAECTGPTSAISSSVYAPREPLGEGRVSSSLAVYHAGERSARTGTITGKLGRSEFEGTITERSGERSFVLRADPGFAKLLPLNALIGSRPFMYGNPGLVRGQLHLDATGGISGSDDAGCRYRGSLTVPVLTSNIYDVSLSSSCVRGLLSGAAVYFPMSGRLLAIVTGDGAGFTLSSYPGP
jgi:hypothetical protein